MQTRQKIFEMVGEESSATIVLGANFSAGLVAGTIAAAATCPLDVAKTRRQIEVVLMLSFKFIYQIISMLVHVPS